MMQKFCDSEEQEGGSWIRDSSESVEEGQLEQDVRVIPSSSLQSIPSLSGKIQTESEDTAPLSERDEKAHLRRQEFMQMEHAQQQSEQSEQQPVYEQKNWLDSNKCFSEVEEVASHLEHDEDEQKKDEAAINKGTPAPLL